MGNMKDDANNTPEPEPVSGSADDGMSMPPEKGRGKGGSSRDTNRPPEAAGPGGDTAGPQGGSPRQAYQPPMFDPDERTRPLRLRPGEPINEYLRRVHDAERSRDWGVSVPAKLYRVSEIASHFHLTRQTVHNYATIGLITERRRTPGGQRLFDESVFHRLHRIHRLKDRYRLHEIRRLLDSSDAGASDAPAAAGTAVETREDTPHRDP